MDLPSRSGAVIGATQVDTAPLLAQVGNRTASWAALPGQLAPALAAHMGPGDPHGATLSVRIDSVYLGGGGPADPDSMRAVVRVSGGGGRARTIRPRATSTYIPSPVDQALVSSRPRAASTSCRRRSPVGWRGRCNSGPQIS